MTPSQQSAPIVTRSASADDIPALVAMGAKFFAQSGFAGLVPFDDESFAKTLAGLIGDMIPGRVIAAWHENDIVGMAGFLLAPAYFNFGETIAQEVFLYVDDGHRFGAGQKLIDAMEESAIVDGAAILIIASLAGLRDAALARIYTRRGYRPAENSFVKKL